MTPFDLDLHVCKLPCITDRTEHEFECLCGRRWHMKWLGIPDGRIPGPGWILGNERQ
jgi:hypothetical protein